MINFLLPLLDSSSWGPSNIACIVLAFLGACSILSAFLPTVIGTYKSKNTVGVNKTMFFLHLGCGLCFFYGALFWLIDAWFERPGEAVQACIFMGLNFTTTMGTLYVILLKDQNAKEAKKYGISELEHYNQYCKAYCETKNTSK